MRNDWRIIPSFPKYEITSDGFIRTIITGRIRSIQTNVYGYHNIVLIDDFGNKRTMLIHRLVLEAFHRPPNAREEACHNDGVRSNNCIENLRWDTRKNNQHDRKKHGTHLIGENSSQHKLSNEYIEKMRHIMKLGKKINYCEEGRKLGVSHETVRLALIGKTYAYDKLGVI